MGLCGLGLKKKKVIFHILHIIVSPLCPTFLEPIDFYKAHHSEKRCMLIGQLSSALLLAECLKHVTVMPFTILWCSVSRCNETKSNKPIKTEAFVASSGAIITGYNDFYCFWIISGKSFTNENVLTGCDSQAPDCPCNEWGMASGSSEELPHFIEKDTGIVGYSPRKWSSIKCSAHICIFWLNCSGTVL